MAAHRSKQEEPVEISGKYIHETDKALLLELDDTGEEMWFPLSVITNRRHEGSAVVILVHHWFAMNKGLI